MDVCLPASPVAGTAAPRNGYGVGSPVGFGGDAGGGFGAAFKFKVSGFRGIRKPTIMATTNAKAIQSMSHS
jgi:hypothetical protein